MGPAPARCSPRDAYYTPRARPLPGTRHIATVMERRAAPADRSPTSSARAITSPHGDAVLARRCGRRHRHSGATFGVVGRAALEPRASSSNPYRAPRIRARRAHRRPRPRSESRRRRGPVGGRGYGAPVWAEVRGLRGLEFGIIERRYPAASAWHRGRTGRRRTADACTPASATSPRRRKRRSSIALLARAVRVA
jgi:hypothetical protein